MFSARIRRMLLPAALAAASVVVLGASGSAGGADYPTCLGEPATIVGTEGNDNLTGTGGDDVIASLGGDDVVVGGGGLDLICGGDGNDTLIATTGANSFFDGAMISGDAGDDRIQASSDALVLADYEGSPAPVTVDLVTGKASGWGADTLIRVQYVYGSYFDDSLTGTNRYDALAGFAGNDTIAGGGGGDLLSGGPGDDSIDGGPGKDELDYTNAPTGVHVNLAKATASGWGADRLRSIEQVDGSHHADVLVGSARADVLVGGAGNDRLYGGGGKDRLYGDRGKDRADGGPAIDVCRAEKTVRCP
jgi:Ca2+-binding RTX toxin-like protein